MVLKERLKERIRRLRESEDAWRAGVGPQKFYNEFHSRRRNLTLEVCRKYRGERDAKVLDVGRSPLTEALADYYKDVSSLGFDLSSDANEGHRGNGGGKYIPHIVFDLTHSENVDAYPDHEEQFDLIVFCETIEHLPIAPELCVIMLSYLLKRDGVLIITTPNAARISARLKLAIGQHPYERITFSRSSPGHFREYTKEELVAIGSSAGLSPVSATHVNFYKPNAGIKSLAYLLGELAPPFRDSIVTVFKKP